MHVQAALDAVRQIGLDKVYDKACKKEEECIKRLQKAHEVFDDYQGSDENPPEKRAVNKANEATTKASKAVKPIINQVFSLYSNLLTEEAWHLWKKIVSEQIDCRPWTDLYGEEHPNKCVQS